MTLVINSHVQRLRRFQPFQPDSAELIYEQSEPDQWFDLAALPALRELIEDPAVRMVVLTGDAGHGKTSLCARVIQELGHSASEAARLIRGGGDGRTAVASTNGGRQLRVLKDLSEISTKAAPSLLSEMLNSPDEHVSIVCANEGRMRSVVAAQTDGSLDALTATLERGLVEGTVSDTESGIRVINLNYQSVAPQGQGGLIEGALRTWAADGRRWQACTRCDARDICPILANHRALSDPLDGPSRRGAIRNLFATAERTNTVVTTRQALATLAFTITGGLQCSDVHARWTKASADRSWQFRHRYHQSIFGDHLTKSQRRQVPVLMALRRLDPGRIALREVDDALATTPDGEDFLPPLPATEEGSPRSRREAQRESDLLHAAMRFLRRRDYFDSRGQGPSLMRRMGFQSGDHFVAAATAGLVGAIDIRDRLLRGLEAVQGVMRPAHLPDFLVIDPAFATHHSRAAVVARRIASRQITVVSQRIHWADVGDGEPELPSVLDWIDRMAVLRVEDSDVAIAIDLLRFELLFRWAAGLSSRVQHESEIRHFANALARLVPAGQVSDEITVLVGGDRRTLQIDVGDRVRSGEG